MVTHVYPMWIDTFALNIFIHREVIRLIFVCSLCSLGNMYLNKGVLKVKYRN